MNRALQLSLILMLLLYSLDSVSQSAKQTQSEYLQTRIDRSIYVNTDSALFYAEKLLQLGLHCGDSLIIAEAYQSLGHGYYYKNDLENALNYYEKALPMFLRLKRPAILGSVYMDYGNLYSDWGQFEKGLKYYKKAEELLIKHSPFADDIACLYYNMAHVFMDVNDPLNQGRFINKALSIALKDDLTYMLPSIQNIQANLAIKKGELAKAEKLSLSALTKSLSETDLIEQVAAHQNLGIIALKRGQLIKGIGKLNSSLAIAEKYGDPYIIATQKALLASAYQQAGNLEKAELLAFDAYELGMKQNSLLVTTKVSRVFAATLEQKGEYQKALEAYKVYYKAKDSINGFEVSEKLLRSKHRISEQQNQLLRAEASILKANNSNSRFLILTISIGLVLSALTIALMVKNIRGKKKSALAVRTKQQVIDEKNREVERKNQELQNLNKGKDKLFSIISHDMKEPFNQVSSFLQILEQNDSLDPELRDLVGYIKESTRNTVFALNNMLMWSKSQFMNPGAQAQKVDMAELVNSVTAELGLSIADKSLNLEIKIEPNSALMADKYHAEIILRNLLTNAIKFSPQHGTVQLEVSRTQTGVEITVRDNGKGMTHEEVKNLFDTNKHFSTPGTFNEKGTGLGLLIVSEFVKENKGIIKIDSQKNKGSTFKVIFPAA